MKQTLRAVIYTRVSTTKQAEEGVGLDVQLKACLHKAVELDAQVVDIHQDAGISGENYLTRPGILKAIADIEAGRADTLICYDISRYSRDSEHQAAIKKRIEAAKGRIVFCTQDFAPGADGELTYDLLRAFPVWENRKRRERTINGKKEKAEQGVQTCVGMRPFGYRIIGKADIIRGEFSADMYGKYIVVEDEAQLVAGIFHRYAAGASLNDVCLWLNEKYIPTPRNGDYWRKSTLKRIMNNPVYKGQAPYNRHERHKDEARTLQGYKQGFTLRKRDSSEWILIPCPAVVDADTWARCQARLQENQRTGGNPNRTHVLTSMLRCPICGRGMRGYRRERNNGRIEHYYHCPDQRASRNPGKHVCNPALYDAKKAETIVKKAVTETAERPELIEHALNAYRQQQPTEYNKAEYKRLTSELYTLEKRERAVIEAQVQGIQQGANPAIYASMFTEVAEKRDMLTNRLKALETLREQAQAGEPQEAAEIVAGLLQNMRDVFDAPEITASEMHDILANVVEQVIPDGEGYRITLRPIQQKSLTVANISTL